MIRERVVGTGVMLGTIIGAGFLALPYAAARSGLGTVFIFLGLLTIVVVLLHTAYGEVVLATHGRHRLPGYAGQYLGPWGKRIAGVSALVGQLGALLLYLIFGGAFVALFLPNDFTWIGTVVFWAILTFLLFLRFRTSALIDAAASWFLVAVLVAISVLAVGRISPEHFSMNAPAPLIFPYGIVMFSLLGLAAVPELTAFESLRAHRALLSVVITGIFGAALLYAVFTWAVLGAVGPGVSPNSFLSMYELLPQWARWIFPFAGLLAIGTSYFTFGYSVRNVLSLDFGFRPRAAAATVALIPIALFLSGFRDIPRIIGFLGGIWISVDATLILLMRERVERTRDGFFRRRKFIGRVLIAFFILGTISSIFTNI